MKTCQICKSEAFNAFLFEQDIKDACVKCAEANKAARVYQVPSDNLPTLNEKFAKLGRRAKRLDLPVPTYTSIKEERVVENEGKTDEKVYLLHYLTVDPGCSTVKIDGWTFVATIQHTEEGNILRKVGEQEIPNKYRNVTQLCEHCNTNRNRKDTYILLHENREYKQVGRNCLADFFGHSALMYAERAQYLVDVSDLGEASESCGGSGPRYDILERYLGHVAQCIQVDGWMSRSRAKELNENGGRRIVISTADIAMDHLHPPTGAARLYWNPLYDKVSQENQTLADQAIEWAGSLEGEDISDYLHNIRVIARKGVITFREVGLAASIVSAYQRQLNQLRQKEFLARRSEIAQHVGQVGDRRIFKLLVENVMKHEKEGYGYHNVGSVVFRHLMSDKDGNVFIWWSSSSEPLEVNKEVTLKGSIKKHDEFKGVKQNVLTRCEQVQMKSFFCMIGTTKYSGEAESEKDFQKELKKVLNLPRWPKGIKIFESSPMVEETLSISEESQL